MIKRFILVLSILTLASAAYISQTPPKLAQVAASMQPGTFALLNQAGDGSGYDRNLLDGNNSNCIGTGSILGYSWKMIYNEAADAVMISAASHTLSGLCNAETLTYDVASNHWSTSGAIAASFFNGHHAYGANSIDPVAHRLYSSAGLKTNTFRALDLNTGIWTQPTQPKTMWTSTASDSQGEPSSEWFPERGKLLWLQNTTLGEYDATADTFTKLATLSALGPVSPMMTYVPQEHIAYAMGGIIDWGCPMPCTGGTYRPTVWSRAMYRIDAVGTVTRIADLPQEIKIYQSRSLISADPVTGDLIVIQSGMTDVTTFTGVISFWKFSIQTHQWSQILPNPIPPPADWWQQVTYPFAVSYAAIPKYGVTMYASAGGNATSSIRVYLYKHANPDSTKLPTTTVTNCPSATTYHGMAQTPCSATVTATDGLNQAVNVSYANNVNAGTAQAAAAFLGDSAHQASSSATSFEIAPAAVTATAGSGSSIYTGSAFVVPACVLTGTYTGTLQCANSPASVGPDPGTYTIAPILSGDNLSNFQSTLVSGNVSIAAAPLAPVTELSGAQAVHLIWTPSANSTLFKITRDGVEIGQTQDPFFNDSVTDSLSHVYGVQAFDPWGGVSPIVTVTVGGGSSGGGGVPPPDNGGGSVIVSAFDYKCSLPGVISCFGFDSASNVRNFPKAAAFPLRYNWTRGTACDNAGLGVNATVTRDRAPGEANTYAKVQNGVCAYPRIEKEVDNGVLRIDVPAKSDAANGGYFDTTLQGNDLPHVRVGPDNGGDIWIQFSYKIVGLAGQNFDAAFNEIVKMQIFCPVPPGLDFCGTDTTLSSVFGWRRNRGNTFGSYTRGLQQSFLWTDRNIGGTLYVQTGNRCPLSGSLGDGPYPKPPCIDASDGAWHQITRHLRLLPVGENFTVSGSTLSRPATFNAGMVGREVYILGSGYFKIASFIDSGSVMLSAAPSEGSNRTVFISAYPNSAVEEWVDNIQITSVSDQIMLWDLANPGWGEFRQQPHMTNRNAAVTIMAGVVYYDELIISTQPIPITPKGLL